MDQEIVNKIRAGKVGILPTDTIYGIVGSAFLPKTIEKIYDIKDRGKSKPLIILIGSISDLSLFQVKLTKETKKILEKYWPGKISIILPCKENKFKFLHRGTETIAFRLPDSKELKRFLNKTGPVVAPSANPEGLPPAKNLDEAKKYFEGKVDFFVDGGTMSSSPSTIISVKEEKIKILRKGAVVI